MNLLVTGGSGLVGSAITADYKPTHDELDLIELDAIIDYIEENQITHIIHCAGRVGGIKANSEHLGEFFYENIIMNSNVLEAARQCGVEKVVSFMSTCVFPDDATYPLSPDQIHNGEPHPSNYAYAYAKRMLEVQSRAYREQYGCNFVTVIPCNIYGPNDNFDLDSSHVIPALIHKCYIAKENGTNFTVWGTGKAYREFIYVDDVATIAKWVLYNYNEPEPFIISPKEEISMAVLAQTIQFKMHGPGTIIYDHTKPDGQLKKPSDNSILKRCLPDFEFIPIQEGLSRTINWFIEEYKVHIL
jgi:GDP-L-fucose synthase